MRKFNGYERERERERIIYNTNITFSSFCSSPAENGTNKPNNAQFHFQLSEFLKLKQVMLYTYTNIQYPSHKCLCVFCQLAFFGIYSNISCFNSFKMKSYCVYMQHKSTYYTSMWNGAEDGML